jgi:tetratricopeptide (TPR) repeat protein
MTDSAQESFRYWAFISYSSKDKEFARWLHRSIESYGVPVQFISHPTPSGAPAPRRFKPLFCDRWELPASADLGAEIENALRSSRYLIVVCSQNAAHSQWVNKEIETFKRLRDRKHVLAVIAESEPRNRQVGECFPPVMRSPEPVAADARRDFDGKINAMLKLLAGMLGVSFDALKQRDAHMRMAQMQRWLMLASTLVVLFAALAGVAWWQRRVAVEQRHLAEERTGTLRRELSGLLWEINDKVESLPGTLSLKEWLLDGIGAQLEELEPKDRADDGLARDVAVSFAKLGAVKLEMGELGEAEESLKKAVSVDQMLVAHDSANAPYAIDLANDLGDLARVYLGQGKPEAAARLVSQALQSMDKVSESIPNYEPGRYATASLHLIAARASAALGHTETAQDEFRISEAQHAALVQSHPRDLTFLRALAAARFEAARFERMRGNLNGAIENARTGGEVLQTINKSDAGIEPAAVVSSAGFFEMAETLLASGLTRQASSDVDDAIALLQETLRTDPKDAVAELQLARGRILQARVMTASGSLASARTYYLDAAQRAGRLVALDKTNASAAAVEAEAYAQFALALRKAGQELAAAEPRKQCSEVIATMRAARQSIPIEIEELLNRAGVEGAN